MIILKVWPETQAIAHFSRCFVLILKMYLLEKFTEPLPVSSRSRSHFRGKAKFWLFRVSRLFDLGDLRGSEILFTKIIFLKLVHSKEKNEVLSDQYFH